MKKILSLLTGLTVLLSAGAALPVSAEEPVKNWDYYWNLDDYSVYREYVEIYGHFSALDDHTIEDTLPAETELPWSENGKFYITNGNGDVIFPFRVTKQEDALTNEEIEARMKTPSYFGFPDSWYFETDGRDFNVLQFEKSGNSHCILGFDFDVLSRNDCKEIPVIRSMVDVYRLHLTLEHSEFAQQQTKPMTTYEGEPEGFHEIFIEAQYGAHNIPGDPNEDGIVNASDATEMLIASARMGAGQESGLDEAQTQAADVNKDGIVNASDSAIVLRYAAAVGSGDRYARLRNDGT